MISINITSTSQKPLIERVDLFLEQVQEYPEGKEVEVAVMLFSFTSDLIFRFCTFAPHFNHLKNDIL